MEINIDFEEFQKLQEQLTEENAAEKLKNVEFPFNSVLPIQIGGVCCERPTWNDFKGTPDPKNQYYLAFIYWAINYFYDTSKKFCEVDKVMKFTVTSLTAQPKIKNHSWCRYKEQDLLHHETGHYVIACLCALEFKKRVLERNAQFYSTSHANEITQIFNATMKEFCALERLYDNESNHYLNEEKQKEWNIKLIQKLLAYKKYFTQLEKVPDSKIMLAQIQGNNNPKQDSKNIQKQSISSKKVVNKNETSDTNIQNKNQENTTIKNNNTVINNSNRVLKQQKKIQPSVSNSSRFKFIIKEFVYQSIPPTQNMQLQQNQQRQNKLIGVTKPPSSSNVSTSTSLATTASTFVGLKKRTLIPRSQSNAKLQLPKIQNKITQLNQTNHFKLNNLTFSP